MRKLPIAVLLLAATALPACSDEASQFAGKSAEEIATFLVFGVMDKTEIVKKTETIRSQVLSAQPFTITADVIKGSERMEILRIVTTKTENCAFVFDLNRGANHPARLETKIAIDLSQLTAVSIDGNGQATFTKAAMTCLESPNPERCSGWKNRPMETISRYALVQQMSGEKHDEADEQKQVDAALAYFRKEICR